MINENSDQTGRLFASMHRKNRLQITVSVLWQNCGGGGGNYRLVSHSGGDRKVSPDVP